MPLPVKTGFPDTMEVGDGYVIRFRAVDPTTGADVAGVKVTNVAIQAQGDGGNEVAEPGVIVPKVGPEYFTGETLT